MSKSARLAEDCRKCARRKSCGGLSAADFEDSGCVFEAEDEHLEQDYEDRESAQLELLAGDSDLLNEM